MNASPLTLHSIGNVWLRGALNISPTDPNFEVALL